MGVLSSQNYKRPPSKAKKKERQKVSPDENDVMKVWKS